MVSTPRARRSGGRTKFVACTTSAGPVSHSTGGYSERAQASCNSRAGARRAAVRTPAGSAPGSSSSPRQVNAVAASSHPAPASRPGSVASRASPVSRCSV
ncbi:hypothetical protein ThrDRAFT_00398 [Frankia casuarinae]|nr:hypothetical protein CcI6DRAFT_00343 [Frankia sp. CcI6]EYT94027.1 hypothetical protein ThrDRAFT_00398 [Frankia casuarinae]KDA44652.1 hypothetical protein BMG523Draft_00502 [Frankia sp. BMG5.23]